MPTVANSAYKNMAVDELVIEGKLLTSFSNVGELSVSNPPHFIRQRCAPCGRTVKPYATGDNVNETESATQTITADFKSIKLSAHSPPRDFNVFKIMFADR